MGVAMRSRDIVNEERVSNLLKEKEKEHERRIHRQLSGTVKKERRRHSLHMETALQTKDKHFERELHLKMHQNRLQLATEWDEKLKQKDEEYQHMLAKLLEASQAEEAQKVRHVAHTKQVKFEQRLKEVVVEQQELAANRVAGMRGQIEKEAEAARVRLHEEHAQNLAEALTKSAKKLKSDFNFKSAVLDAEKQAAIVSTKRQCSTEMVEAVDAAIADKEAMVAHAVAEAKRDCEVGHAEAVAALRAKHAEAARVLMSDREDFMRTVLEAAVKAKEEEFRETLSQEVGEQRVQIERKWEDRHRHEMQQYEEKLSVAVEGNDGRHKERFETAMVEKEAEVRMRVRVGMRARISELYSIE
jgi:hypothetical protein